MTDRDPMAVQGAQPELAHLPRLVLNLREQIGTFGFELVVASVGVGNAEVCEVAVATQLTRGKIIRALPEHDHAVVLRDEDPARRLGDDMEAKHLHVEIRRPACVMDG